MQQTILSQASASGAQQDVPGAKAGSSSRSSEKGESRFDQVSRSEQNRLEQRRLEQKRVDRQDQAESIRDKRDTRDAQQPEETAASNTASQETNNHEANSTQPDEEVQTTSGDEHVPLTFANLQTLLPSTGSAPDGALNLGVVNGGLSGKSLLAGSINGQTGNTVTLNPASQFSDLLAANVTAETTRPADPASLISSSRFQATLDVAAQQGKLAGESALPLRGYSTTVDVPVGQAEWGDKVMGKLSWLTARNMQVAEIHLTPPDMGPMEVKVRVHNDQATVTVHAANPVVREQLELHSNRLRDMLGEQGLLLSQFDVSDQSGQHTGAQGGDSEEGSGFGSPTDGLSTDELEEPGIQSGQLDLAWKGEVDIFA
ncbi:flagellar hook-length control protein FliK [Marinobacter sp.]|uniref:flagellar hook-length control protein FliK n=1 Tax=Marinobacter sp. TaxID=50741 RepID=UPI0035630C5A